MLSALFEGGPQPPLRPLEVDMLEQAAHNHAKVGKRALRFALEAF